MNNTKQLLESIYEEAIAFSNGDDEFNLSEKESALLDEIIKNSERSKGVLTVFITSLAYKIENPDQDIRMHQAQIPGGYGARTYDTQNITPFMKDKKFPAMSESGWLTRSLEQPFAYTLDYQGKITPKVLKTAFLKLLDFVQTKDVAQEYLLYVLTGLILKRDSQLIRLARPNSLPISTIISHLERHFNESYTTAGASRLPSLAIYAAYECLIDELKRFEGKTLMDIVSHTSADSQSGRIGDIDIIDEEGKPFARIGRV